jgi:hypothetical protein
MKKPLEPAVPRRSSKWWREIDAISAAHTHDVYKTTGWGANRGSSFTTSLSTVRALCSSA